MRLNEREKTSDSIDELYIDFLYQDEFLQLLRTLKQPLWIGFYDGRALAEVLDQSQRSTEEFIDAQKRYVYGSGENLEHKRKSFYEAATLRDFLNKCGIEVKTVVIDDEKITWFFILPSSNGITIPSGVEQAVTNLPLPTETFYKGTVSSGYEQARQQATNLPLPRILNIGSGGDENRQIPHAINVDLSGVGKPHVIADARYLPFADHSMTMVMASHVLEHMTFQEAKQAIKEWFRVLHPKGIMRVAVPDASKTLMELRSGITQKGESSFAIPGGSAPLTQLQGLGGENSATHLRWRHQVLYNTQLLERLVRETVFDKSVTVRDYTKEEALSLLSGIKLDETNRYSLRAQFELAKTPQPNYYETTYEEYIHKKDLFLKEHSFDVPISIIIPIRNEAENLPTFFSSFLEIVNELKKTDVLFEVIFSLNGCDDASEEIVRDFCQAHSDLSLIVSSCKPGILHAFTKGVEERRLDGFIAKLDVDTQSNCWNILLLYMELIEKEEKLVTYAEVAPLEQSPTPFNLGEFYQQLRTERLYFHGRMSMYKENPFTRFPKELILNSGAQVEDMILSSLYIYYAGIDSIGVTNGAIVRSVSISTFDKLQKNWVRSRAEIKRICNAFPQFEVLRSVLRREPIAPPSELKDSDPEMYSLWTYYYHLHIAFQELAKLEKLSPDNKPPEEWTSVRGE